MDAPTADEVEPTEEVEAASSGMTEGKVVATTAKRIKKALGELKKRIAHIKKRLNVKKNLRYFEESARDPARFDALIALIERLAAVLALLLEQKKRAQQPRYLRPEVRKFMQLHPLQESQPELPRLSKGKGVATKQMVCAYVYGYLGQHCEKAGSHAYVTDEPMKELVLALTGQEKTEIGFTVIPTLVTKALISAVTPLEEDIELYAAVLGYFARLKKAGVKAAPRAEEDVPEEEGEVEEEGEEEEA
jgi:hypothetical protein